MSHAPMQPIHSCTHPRVVVPSPVHPYTHAPILGLLSPSPCTHAWRPPPLTVVADWHGRLVLRLPGGWQCVLGASPTESPSAHATMLSTDQSRDEQGDVALAACSREEMGSACSGREIEGVVVHSQLVASLPSSREPAPAALALIEILSLSPVTSLVNFSMRSMVQELREPPTQSNLE